MSMEALSLFLFKVIYLVDYSIRNNSLGKQRVSAWHAM